MRKKCTARRSARWTSRWSPKVAAAALERAIYRDLRNKGCEEAIDARHLSRAYLAGVKACLRATGSGFTSFLSREEARLSKYLKPQSSDEDEEG